MFDRLDDILIHYEEIMQELGEPNVTENQSRFRKLMKEQADRSIFLMRRMADSYMPCRTAGIFRSSARDWGKFMRF